MRAVLLCCSVASIKTNPSGTGSGVSGGGGVWYCFDDHSVRELDETALREPAHTGAAYLLFYQRRDSISAAPQTPTPSSAAAGGTAAAAVAAAEFGSPTALDDLMRGWVISDAERRLLRSYPGSSVHTKKKAQLKSLQDAGNCVIL